MNRVVLAGRLTKDPELRYTPNGNAVARFTVAVTRPFRNQQGEQKTDFVNCVAWRKQAENLANYQRKGSMVGVDGKIQTDSYDDQDGKRVFVTEVLAEQIHFLGSRKDGGGGGGNRQRQQDAHEQFQPQPHQGQGNYQQPAPTQGQGNYQQPAPTQGQGNYGNAPQQPQGQGGGNPHGAVDIQDDELPF